MKKSLFAGLFAAAFAVAPNTCAEIYINNTTNNLPAQGDYAIGIDVVPLLRTIGGAFNGSDDSVPVGGAAFSYDGMYLKPNVSILGKYMLSDVWGLRVNLGFTLRKNTNKAYTADDLNLYLDPTSNAKVVDTEDVTRFGGSLMFGVERRVGERRVQGVFGFGLLFAMSSYSTQYSYGNAITELNQRPSAAFAPSVAVPTGYRVRGVNARGPNFTIGAYASVGVEWFVAPKVSLGAEVDLYMYGTIASNGYVESEGFNAAYRAVEHRTDLYTPGNSSFNFGTDNLGAALCISYYF